MKTKVIFRKWPKKEGGDVIALFPLEIADNSGVFCSSYERVGQHSGADCRGVINRTKPAKPSEYADLKVELERIGYELEIIKRCPANAYEVRKAAILKT